MHLIVTGNPVDGFTFHGPFADRTAALDWADRECEADWWLAPLDLSPWNLDMHEILGRVLLVDQERQNSGRDPESEPERFASDAIANLSLFDKVTR